MPFARCVGLVVTEESAHVLLRDDGTFIEFVPSRISNGDDLRAAIISALPEHLVIPVSPAAEAVSVVEDAAASLPRRWLVTDELAALPQLLGEEERVEVMAEATIRLSAGLLTLTDRHLIFLAFPGLRKKRKKEVVLPRRDVVSARARGDRLDVATGDRRKVTFKEITPPERSGQLAAALGGQPQRRVWVAARRLRPLAIATLASSGALLGRPVLAGAWALVTFGDVFGQGGIGKKVSPRSALWINRFSVGIAAAALLVSVARAA